MRKIKLFVALFLMMSFNFVEAQDIRIERVSDSSIDASVADILYGRLTQAVELNGLVSTDGKCRFVLEPSVNVLSIETTTTIPIKYVAEVEVVLSLVDNFRKIILSQVILTKKGIGKNTSQAVGNAIKSVKSRDSKLKKMIALGKEQINAYYKAECDSVVEPLPNNSVGKTTPDFSSAK